MCSQRQLQFLLTKIPHLKRSAEEDNDSTNESCLEKHRVQSIADQPISITDVPPSYSFPLGNRMPYSMPSSSTYDYPTLPHPHNTSILTSAPHLHPHGNFHMCHLAMPRFQHTCKICPPPPPPPPRPPPPPPPPPAKVEAPKEYERKWTRKHIYCVHVTSHDWTAAWTGVSWSTQSTCMKM